MLIFLQFEIKQLRAYLDKDATPEQLEIALQNVSSHCDVISNEYSSDLEKAIALSKETFKTEVCIQLI